MPIDSSLSTRQKVPFVTELARFFGATVHILGVSEISSADVTAKITTYCTQVEEYLKEKGVNCTKNVLVGSNITDLTIEYAKTVDAELITIMTDQLTNAAFWLGPYAQQMVNHASIPVLSIRSQN
jgi:nucleotide-binding universal stress UspA family protein